MNATTEPLDRGRADAATGVEAFDHEPALSVRDISKRFGGAHALRSVSIDFYPGEIHALLGENGAGKSTLMKILAGSLRSDGGRIDVRDDWSIAMVYQELSVLPELSVRDNLLLGLRQRRRGFLPRRRADAEIADALAAAGLTDLPLDLPVEALPLAQRQLLEIARGVIANAKILILDEPTATLSDVEIARVHQVARSLTSRGHVVIYITHRMGEVFALSDRITVMRTGQVVANGKTADFTMKEIVVAMLGDAPEHQDRQRDVASPHGEVLLTAHGITSGRAFAGVNVTVRAGEITALFGQVGSGADTVVKALAGLREIDGGTVELRGKTVTSAGRHGLQAQGVTYVSADRVREGVFLEATVARNISSGALRRVSSGGILRSGREARLAREVAHEVRFDAARIRVPVSSLSGGNQQKVALGRALAAEPVVLILDEPTRGVDIGARATIYQALRALAAKGVAILVYSSDIVELRELVDSVTTMFRGRVVTTHAIDEVTDARLLTEILHGTEAG